MEWVEKIPEAVAAAFAGLAVWVGKVFHRRVDNHAERIRELEIDRVKRDDIVRIEQTMDEMRSSLTATMTHGLGRVEDSVQTLTRHLLERRQ